MICIDYAFNLEHNCFYKKIYEYTLYLCLPVYMCAFLIVIIQKYIYSNILTETCIVLNVLHVTLRYLNNPLHLFYTSAVVCSVDRAFHCKRGDDD